MKGNGPEVQLMNEWVSVQSNTAEQSMCVYLGCLFVLENCPWYPRPARTWDLLSKGE